MAAALGPTRTAPGEMTAPELTAGATKVAAAGATKAAAPGAVEMDPALALTVPIVRKRIFYLKFDYLYFEKKGRNLPDGPANTA